MTVFCSASQSVRRRYPVNTPREGGLRTTRSVDIRVTLSPLGVAVIATAVPDCADEAPVSVTHDQPLNLTPARAPQGTAAALHKAFERTGDTCWQVRRLDLIDPQGLCAAVTPERNPPRRAGILDAGARSGASLRLAALMSDLAFDQAPAAPPPPAQLRWSLKLRLDTGVVPEAADADEIVLSLGLASLADIRTCLTAWLAHLPRPRLRLALPLIVRDHESGALEQTVAALLADGWTRWECASLAGAHLLRRLAGGRPDAIEQTADWSFYALNRVARAQLMELGIIRGVASPEDSRSNLQALASFPPPLEALVFQHTPLFIAATTPLTITPARDEWLFDDRRGRRLNTRRRDGCTITVAQAPFCLADRTADLATLGIGWVRCDFSWSPGQADDCARAWRETRAGRRPPDSHVGNYLRGLL